MKLDDSREYKLVTLRLLIRRKQYEEARHAIEQMLLCEPECQEALDMLNELKTKLLPSPLSETELDYGCSVFEIDTVPQCLLVSVVGILTFALGLYFGLDMIHVYFANGNHGNVDLHSAYTTHPISYPIYTLLVLPGMLLGLGGWLIVTAYHSWREMKG